MDGRSRIVVSGASGFVGRALCQRLDADGHDVVALGRRRDALPEGPRIRPEVADVADTERLVALLRDARAAYYLIHSMAGADFEDRDRGLADSFGLAAAKAGVGRIVYLGALGAGELSTHLASRQEVGRALAAHGVPVVELRAAVVLGAGSVSFEMMRYLVERLPVMVCPRWVQTRIQPVGLRDVLSYLASALDAVPGVYEIGAPQTTTYRELMDAYAAARGLPRRVIVNVPLLTLRLSSYWVDLVTPVNRRVSHALIESLASEVVVADASRTHGAFAVAPMGIADAMDAVLHDQERELSSTLLARRPGLRDGVYVRRREVEIPRGVEEGIRRDLRRAGGDLRWYGLWPLWRLRLSLGRLLGEKANLRRPPVIQEGVRVDWWRVARETPSSLVLETRKWRTGDAWLGFEVRDGRLVQVVAFRPRGAGGFLYWKALGPIHTAVFRAMARHRIRRGRTA